MAETDNLDLPPKVLLSHPGTGPFVQHAALALHEADLLRAYVTSFAYQPASRLGTALREVFKLTHSDAERHLSRRQVTELPAELVKVHPLPELVRMLPVKLGLGPIVSDLLWEPMELWFDRIVARKHLDGVTAVYGYEHASLETFRAQKERGGLCIYDMPICHHATTQRWVGEEFRKLPQLATSYDRHRMRLAARRNQRKDAELELADRVVAASDFVAQSLVDAGTAREKIWVVPSGAPEVDTSKRAADPKRFVFLVAGTLSVRKGTHYVLSAWSKLRLPFNVELWLVGNWQLPNEMRRNLPGNVVLQDTVPRQELYGIFDRANVLVLPTLAEGLALTPLQAMARGLPVITTPNSGAGNFIRSGENGWIIPPCDDDALAQTMMLCCEDPSSLEAMGRRAAQQMSGWQWSQYRAKLRTVMSAYLDGDWRRNLTDRGAVVTSCN